MTKQKLFWKLGGLILVIGLLFAALPVGQAQAATLDVCPSGCTYSTIQEAITAATAGDIIQVAAGTYNEQINIDKALTLIGPNTGIDPNTGSRVAEAIITGSPVGVTVQPEVGVVTLDGFTVQGYTDWGFHQIYTAAVVETSVHVINNIFDPLANTYWYAVEVNSDGSTVLNNLIKAGTAADASNSIGIVTYDSSSLRIEDNVIGGTPLIGGGIIVSYYKQAGVSGVTISGNTINNAEEAIMLYGIEWEEPAGSGTWLHDGSIANVTIDHNIINIANEAIQAFSLDSLSNLIVEYNQFNDVHTSWGAVVDINFTDAVSGLDLSPNWWDKTTSPVPGTNWDEHYDIYVNAGAVAPSVYVPWCGDAGCTTLVYPPTKLYMNPATGTTTDTCGATVVEVMVQEVEDLTAYHLEITFDPNQVTVNSVTNGGFLDATGAFLEPTNTTGNSTGRIIWGLAQLGSGGDPVPVDGSGSLIKITFTPKVAGEVVFEIQAAESTLVNWPDVQLIPYEVTGGATFNFGSVVTNTTKSPTVSYCDLATAVSAATSGDTLRADVDFETTASVNLNKTIIFNTNGHTITRNNAASDYDSVFYVNSSGNLTVNGGGTLISTNGTAATLGAAIQIAGPVSKTASVTLEGGTTLSGGYSSIYVYRGTFTMTGGTVTDGIAMMTGGTANISGGVVRGTGAAISGNSSQSGSNITISGTAEIDGGDGWAIYHPQQGNLIINGGTITGAIGVEMRAGTLTISGSPTITATAGDAILINGDVSSAYLGLLSATISGGEFNSTGGYALHETAPATTRTSNIAVSGGKFTGDPNAVYFTTIDPLILKLTGGAYNTDPGDKTLVLPDYVYEPYDTYLNTTDNYYYIEEILLGRIDVLPSFATLLNLTVTGDGTFVDFLGDIPWYPADPSVGRTQGNHVAVVITEPEEGFDPAVATMTIGTQTPWVWNDIRNTDGWVDIWQKIKTVPQETLMVLKWNNVSTQTFPVRVLTGSVLLPPPAPIIDSTDIQGYYLTGEPQEFHVSLTNPDPGASYTNVIFKVSVTADVNDLSLRYWENLTSEFRDLPLTCDAGTGVCTTYYGPADGFPIDPGYYANSLFELTAAVAGSYPFEITLIDLAAGPDAVLATYTNTGVVYDKPTVTIAGDPYYIVGEPGAFTVTINNPITGRFYDNTAVFDIVINDHVPTDISALTCSMAGHTWDLLSALTPVDTDMVARIVGEDGYFIVPPTGTDAVVTCSITYATAGTYVSSGAMVDVDVLPEPDAERVVSENIPATATVYTAPVIDATFPAGPYAAGVPVTVPITITNPDGIPGPFDLVLDLPDGTVISYGGNTYTCGDDPETTEVEVGCPPIPVTLPIDPAADLVITFNADYEGSVGMSLYDSDWTPEDRLLASFTEEGVIVNSGFVVTGTFSMQGNVSRAGIPVTLTWTGLPVYGPFANTIEASSNNLSLTLTYGGDYTLTTSQARYLNVTKTITNLVANRNMPALVLKGGNAYWNTGTALDNVIDTSDASLVGTQYGTAGSDAGNGNNGDCNFDGKVNIQDLALVGGNYDLTSSVAYASWLP